jgi:hypothetical protein
MEKVLENSNISIDSDAQRNVEKDHYSINEEIDKHIVEYIKSRIPIKNNLRNQENKIWIEKELDEYILSFVKSKLPITNLNNKQNNKASNNELESPLNDQPMRDIVKTANIERQEKFSPEIAKLLLELIKN